MGDDLDNRTGGQTDRRLEVVGGFCQEGSQSAMWIRFWIFPPRHADRHVHVMAEQVHVR